MLPVQIELQLHPRPEDQAVCRPAKVEHAGCSPLVTCWPTFTVMSFVETSAIPTEMKDMRQIVGESASMRTIARAATSVIYLCKSLGAEESSLPREARSGRSHHEGHLCDGSTDGTVPAVVAEGAQECLADGATEKLLADRIVREHVPEGVRLPLDPEVVDSLDVVGELERRRLAGVDDH